MLRMALGESTVSLDSTVRSDPAAPSLSPGLGVARLSEPAQACSSPFQAGWGGPWPCVWLSSWCCFPCPRGAACLPGRRRSAHLPHCSRDEGDQKLSVSSGPARGGHGEPDLPFVPKSTKKPHGTCPPEMVSCLPTLLPPRGLWVAASPRFLVCLSHGPYSLENIQLWRGVCGHITVRESVGTPLPSNAWHPAGSALPLARSPAPA